MTLQRFQGVVLKLGNQMFVRHYLWLNYPEDPQLMGIQFANITATPNRSRSRTCECGKCKTCKHREYQNTHRPKGPLSHERLFGELKEMGFKYRKDGIWAIERSDEA